ncbi:MAG TPA: NUDIX hydrolase [Patescibacteria group bacterium]|nr:NUDIX hydrolase [Patescibacteria group bacterium]
MQLLAGVAIFKNNKVLLLKNVGGGDQNDKWGPPAGHGEANETTEETAIREAKEETNLDVELLGIIQVGYFNYHAKDYLYVFYLAKAKDLSKINLQKEEVSEYIWASKQDLLKNKYEFRKEFLKEPILLSFEQKPSKNNLFKIYTVK